MEQEVEVEIPDDIRGLAASIRERVEILAAQTGINMNEIIMDLIALQGELSKPIIDIVEIEPPDYSDWRD